MSDFGMQRLSQIGSYRDIVSPSAAIRRGMHCPLFGCTLLMQSMEKTVTVVLGTEECGFYSKEILKVIQPDGYMQAPVYCYALEESDIVFGCEKQVLALLEQIYREEAPELIFLVSTCVTELIGEDSKTWRELFALSARTWPGWCRRPGSGFPAPFSMWMRIISSKTAM